jgi:DNA-directed RNA polymerase specialized sigma24 family protein
MLQTRLNLEEFHGASSTSRSGITIEYAAFRQLNYAAYLDYACIRTGNRERAMRCVDIALDTLWVTWNAALRDSPAARGWELLREQVDDVPICNTAHDWTAHCILPTDQADAILLHRKLGLTVAGTAELMGMPDYAVRALLRTGDRMLSELPSCLGRLLPVL